MDHDHTYLSEIPNDVANDHSLHVELNGKSNMRKWNLYPPYRAAGTPGRPGRSDHGPLSGDPDRAVRRGPAGRLAQPGNDVGRR